MIWNSGGRDFNFIVRSKIFTSITLKLCAIGSCLTSRHPWTRHQTENARGQISGLESGLTRKESIWQKLVFTDHSSCRILQDWKHAWILSLYIIIRITGYHSILGNKYSDTTMIRLLITWNYWPYKGYDIKTSILMSFTLPLCCVPVPQYVPHPPKKKKKRKERKK